MKSSIIAPRVLVAEDEMLIALDIESELSKSGFEVIGPAATLEETMRLARSEHLDAAVLDMNLRDQSAHAALVILQCKGVPFLVVSGYANPSLPPDLTPYRRLNKPFDPRQIAGLIFQMLAGVETPRADFGNDKRFAAEGS